MEQQKGENGMKKNGLFGKIGAIFLVFLMLFSIAGCHSSGSAKSTSLMEGSSAAPEAGYNRYDDALYDSGVDMELKEEA